MYLPHLAARLYGTPLLLARAKLDVILCVLGERIQWPHALAGLAEASPRLAPPSAGLPMDGLKAPPGIAVIDVHGTLVRRSMGLEAASGLSSYAEVAARIDAALDDPAVQGILLDVDSPGGEAGGVFELGQRIRAANAVKPVWAVASDSAFSAAYAIACAASRLYVSQTGGVGSIGVIAMHVDQSQRDAKDGYRYTAVTAGARKDDFSAHQPLQPQALASLQAEVDRLYALFVEHVAGLRGLDASAVRATEAGLFFGPQAIQAGLADRLGSTEAALADFAAFLGGNTGPPAWRLLAQTMPSPAPSSAPSPTSSATSSAIPAATAAAAPSPSLETLPMTLEHSPNLPPEPAPETAAPKEAQPNAGPSAEPATTPAPTPNQALHAAASAAASQARCDAVAVAELCQLAGRSDLILNFLAEGASPAQARQALLAARAQSPEIGSRIHPDAPLAALSAEHNPLMRAVKKLTGKD